MRFCLTERCAVYLGEEDSAEDHLSQSNLPSFVLLAALEVRHAFK